MKPHQQDERTGGRDVRHLDPRRVRGKLMIDELLVIQQLAVGLGLRSQGHGALAPGDVRPELPDWTSIIRSESRKSTVPSNEGIRISRPDPPLGPKLVLVLVIVIVLLLVLVLLLVIVLLLVLVLLLLLLLLLVLIYS